MKVDGEADEWGRKVESLFLWKGNPAGPKIQCGTFTFLCLEHTRIGIID